MTAEPDIPDEPAVAWEDFERAVDRLLELPPDSVDISDLEPDDDG